MASRTGNAIPKNWLALGKLTSSNNSIKPAWRAAKLVEIFGAFGKEWMENSTADSD